jgi:hypothetical protein
MVMGCLGGTPRRRVVPGVPERLPVAAAVTSPATSRAPVLPRTAAPSSPTSHPPSGTPDVLAPPDTTPRGK